MAGTGTAHLRTQAPAEAVVLRVEDLVVEFPIGRNLRVSAVAGISFDVQRGETLGIVGESGCGKSTTGRAVMQITRPTSGTVEFEGTDLTGLSAAALREARTRLQMIFQDPISSLNPRRRVRDSVKEPLEVWRRGTARERDEVVDAVLESVGIDPQRAAESRPHQFSGGQRQRISIARALVLDPAVVICDEPVSALDVSVQAQVLNLLQDLKAEYGLTLIFIAHDLAVVKNVSDRVAVMYLGKLCEVASSDDLYARPAHPYTKVLLDSIPVPDPDVTIGTPTSVDRALRGKRATVRCPTKFRRERSPRSAVASVTALASASTPVTGATIWRGPRCSSDGPRVAVARGNAVARSRSRTGSASVSPRNRRVMCQFSASTIRTRSPPSRGSAARTSAAPDGGHAATNSLGIPPSCRSGMSAGEGERRAGCAAAQLGDQAGGADRGDVVQVRPDHLHPDR